MNKGFRKKFFKKVAFDQRLEWNRGKATERSEEGEFLQRKWQEKSFLSRNENVRFG